MQILSVGFSFYRYFHVQKINLQSKFLKSNIQNKCADCVLCNTDVTTVDRTFKNLHVAKASEIYEISAKCLKDGALVYQLFILLTL